MKNSHSRFGLILFGIYFAFYAGFVVLNAFRSEVMETRPVAGINLAIIYGFGLILGAFVLSMIYGFFRTDDDSAGPGPGPGENQS